ncbi:hypothetical protein [Microbacterium allomyrinae]|uniref:Uncharacterized protein n=1 Tax=Microbacterium allomyrinae TaxID=2830666 RepID=A0A9X1S5R3_9MICO|nr:hypothetical protein [Microbacterium allomyrinae]MCC2034110.1 hypothetical protein [Microbacterium allomyrinae]
MPETPLTRAEARELEEDGFTVLESEIVTEPAFLPLVVRRSLYLLGIAGLVAGPLIGVQLPEYGDAIATGGALLGSIALGTALANPTR